MNTQLSLNLPRQPLPRQHRAETRQRDSLSSSSEAEEAEEAESNSSASSSASESSDMSIDGSCVSSDAEQDSAMSSPETIRTAAAPVAAAAPMVLAGCPRCLMYVMLSDSNPKCPKCKSTVLLDFLNQR